MFPRDRSSRPQFVTISSYNRFRSSRSRRSSSSSSSSNASRETPASSQPQVHTAVENSPLPAIEELQTSAAEDYPLPAIEMLQISGEAFPGKELHACGYSINGTISCNFQWVRYMEDGSVNHIEGAKQPTYLVTVDDVDSYLAVDVVPLDGRERKGEHVQVFANEHQKIACDPEMKADIEKTLFIGHMRYEVLLSANYINMWEQAFLEIKMEGYSIKFNWPRGVVDAEKFLPSTVITVPHAHPTEFSIQCANGNKYLFRTKDNSTQ